MPTYAAASIRNVAVVGHNGSGKTQLISALLFSAGATNRLGRVDDGTAPTDFDEEAIVRKHTLAATPAWLDWHGTKVNLVDTPGFGNFLSETGATLRVTDAALVVVDAVAGVEVQTERVWALADRGAPGEVRCRQPPGLRARQLCEDPRGSACGFRADPRAGTAAVRRGKGLPRRHRPGRPTGLHLRGRHWTRQAGRHSGKHRGRGEERQGSVGGTRCRGRRRTDVAVLRRGDAQRRRTRGGTPYRRAHRCNRPRYSAPREPRTSAPIVCSRRWCTTRPHLWIDRCRPSRGRAATQSRRQLTTPGRRARSSGRRWPSVRRPHLAVPGCHRRSCATTPR